MSYFQEKVVRLLSICVLSLSLVTFVKVDAATIATDSFTGIVGTALQDHVADSGHNWVRHVTATGNATLVSGGVRDTSYTIPVYYLNVTPTSAEYDVELKASGSNYVTGPAGRVDASTKTMYAVYWVPTDGWRLLKIVNGSITTLGRYFGDSPGTSIRTVRLEIKNATKKIFIDGVERVSSTDNAIIGPGRPGLYFGGDFDLKDDFVVSENSSVVNNPSTPVTPVPTPINGSCGSSNNLTVTTAPTTNLCSTGTASSVTGSGPWNWSCAGSNGGTSASCSAQKTVVTVPAPTATLTANATSISYNTGTTLTWTSDNATACSLSSGQSGTSGSFLTGNLTTTTTYTLNCSGVGGSVSKTVTINVAQATTPINGICGSSNNLTVSTAPTTNLCSMGTASSVTGSGPWSWSCGGSNGGTSVSCSAQKLVVTTPTPTPTPTTGVYYVATTGSDSNNGSTGAPFRTISKAISTMKSGEMVIVRNGTYVGRANFINMIPSGTASKYSVVMAENPMEVRIKNISGESLGYDERMVQLDNYTKVDGFIFDMADTVYPPYTGMMVGNYNKLTRSIFKRAGVLDAYGGMLHLSGSYNLVEDVAVVGVCRYCISQGGPSATTKYNILRRVVGRFDYASSNQPKATFSVYGNEGTGTGVSDHTFQNVVVLDGQLPLAPSGEPKYAGIISIKGSTKFSVQGSIVLNEAVTYAGIHLGENGAGNNTTNSVSWDLKNSTSYAAAFRSNSGAGNVPATNVTAGGYLPGGFTYSYGGPAIASASSLLVGSSSIKPANILNNTPGAVIMNKIGVSGTLYGESGWNITTGESLWPWPYEDKIKAVFAEVNTPPTSVSSQSNLPYTPSTNNTKRGFAADGNGLYGGPRTLTSYIWEYLGTPCPSNICVGGTGAPSTPQPTPTPVTGVCGSSNNQTFSSVPTTNLCSSGTASSVTGSGPWNWSCGGSNGGTSASCSAQKTLVTIPTPIVPTPTPATPVAPAPVNPSTPSAPITSGSGGGNSSVSPSTPASPVACTMDARMCPDGVTFVGRTGPNCEFQVCPGTTSPTTETVVFNRNLTLGSKGEDVKLLQQFLNSVVVDGKKPFRIAIVGTGSLGKETTTFGPATKRALARFQTANKITPAQGYFGPTTRALVNSLIK